MIKISNKNTVNGSLLNLCNFIQKNPNNNLVSTTIQIPIKKYPLSFGSLFSYLPEHLKPKDFHQCLLVTKLTFESPEIINNIRLSWGDYIIPFDNPNNKTTITVPITCWLSENDLTYCIRKFNFFFQPQSLPEFINCTIYFAKLSRKWFDYGLENGGIGFIKEKYYISKYGSISGMYPQPPVEFSLIKKNIFVLPIKDEFKVLTKIWCQTQEDLNLISILPGFISEYKEEKENEFLVSEKNLGDCLPFKKCYFMNHQIENTFKNSQLVSYYNKKSCNYKPSEQLIKQYENKLDELVIIFNQIIEKRNSDLMETFNMDHELNTLTTLFKDNYTEEYNKYSEYIKSSNNYFESKSESRDTCDEINTVAIDKVEVSKVALLTSPVKRHVTIFYSDKTVKYNTLYEPDLIKMYGHLFDQSTKQYLKMQMS